MNSRYLKLAAFAAALAGGATLAMAQQAAPAPGAPTAEGGRGGGALAACRGDMLTFCAGTEQGQGKRLECLAQNRERVSAACQTAMQELMQKEPRRGAGNPARDAARQACATDAQTLCQNAGKGGATMSCLRENAAKLSDACKTALIALPVRKGGEMRPTGATAEPPLAPPAQPTKP